LFNGQKIILEGNRIGGASADVSTAALGEYEFPPPPSFRCRMAIAIGVEATQ
jgi:hypothetical protein